jgi:GT2 family glycosyltransferase
MAVTVTAVVPTVGASPLLGECLRALCAQRLDRQVDGEASGHGELEIVLVRQGEASPSRGGEELSGGRVREIRLPRNLGFAAATNRGIAAARGPYVATVNDDVVVEPGWLRALVEALEAAPGAAAAQGVNLQPSRGPARPVDRPEDRAETPTGSGARVDGWGLGWNRAAQAIQLGRDGAPPDRDEPPFEVFGVSATAAVYRRSALLDVARGALREAGATDGGESACEGSEVFDSRLESYYEDADLACRLRAAGHTALSVPAAQALHAGSLTGERLGGRRWRLLYGNRYAVAARLLGRGLWRRLPRMVARDVADLGRALGRGELRKLAGIAGGWARAARLLPVYAHRGAPTEGSP